MEMTFQRSIDYLTITGHFGLSGVPSPDRVRDEMEHPHRFYDETYRLSSGGTLSLGGDTQGDKLEWSGEGLRALRRMGASDEEIIHSLSAYKCTRLDFAADCIGGGSIIDVVEALKWHAAHTWKAHVMHYDVQNSDAGETIDLGSRQSDEFMRIYDKGYTEKTEYVWTRIELQRRQKYAQALFRDMLTYGVQKSGIGAIRKVLIIPDLEWYARAIDGDYVDPSPVYDDVAGDFWRWMSTTVRPALIKRIKAGERERVEAFFKAVLAEGRQRDTM